MIRLPIKFIMSDHLQHIQDTLAGWFGAGLNPTAKNFKGNF
jgi:hypothetical protein